MWDINSGQCIRSYQGHKSRVGSLAWQPNIFASAGRNILIHDPRTQEPIHNPSSVSSSTRPSGHRGEICGLKWSPDDSQLASGGNDNKLFIWCARTMSKPLHSFTEHKAAVKAIAWDPNQRGSLCSGGGSSDRCIRFWNTQGSGRMISHIDTGSQVCNLLWGRKQNEIISTHGHTNHEIVVWSYPTMQPITILRGHTSRVLYLCSSPCQQNIITGSGDETLRFWDLTNNNGSHSSDSSSSKSAHSTTSSYHSMSSMRI